ncbi:MAG TPA: beta tubulin [Rhodospirillaceae bacterium]|nr:beta tubulin [Rhodospirillaceae bacterium]
MKTISTALQAHLDGELTTLAELVKITRADETIIAFTTHDADLIADGVTYKADGSYSGGALKQDTNLKANDFNVLGILGSEQITRDDLEAGLYDLARIDVFLCNWSDLSQGLLRIRRGWIGEVTFSDGQYIASLRGFQDMLSRRVGETYTPECRYDLGEARCGVDLSSLAVTGTVSGTIDGRSFVDNTRSEDSGFFNDAKLTWTSGDNTGVSVEINNWDLSSFVFTLWLPVNKTIAAGDAYTVTPGCDKRFTTCRTRFNNAANYGGFPHLPGLSKILLYPDSK